MQQSQGKITLTSNIPQSDQIQMNETQSSSTSFPHLLWFHLEYKCRLCSESGIFIWIKNGSSIHKIVQSEAIL